MERDRCGKKAGKGALVKHEVAPCIAAAQDTTLFTGGCSNFKGWNNEKTVKAETPKEKRTMKYLSVCSGVEAASQEEWREVANTNGNYLVSSLGRVARVRSYGLHILKPIIGTIKYPTVHLSVNSRRRRCTIHRLVAIAFLPNPHKLPQVNHKDENPLNAAVSNLEWCTEVYNHNYGTCRERGHEKISHRVVFEGVEYKSIRECARKTGHDRRYIRSHAA